MDNWTVPEETRVIAKGMLQAQEDIVLMWQTLKDMCDQAQRYREDTLDRITESKQLLTDKISFLARAMFETREDIKTLRDKLAMEPGISYRVCKNEKCPGKKLDDDITWLFIPTNPKQLYCSEACGKNVAVRAYRTRQQQKQEDKNS